MSRDIEPLLAPWMERQARGAPYDLLPRVMREVRSMSQESRAFGAGLLSFSMVAWLTGGIAIVATAIAAGVLIANLSGAPAGGQGSPSPTATPSSAAGTIRESDPVGDATGNAPDIVAVGISRVSEDLFMLDIELAEPMASGTELTVWLETNGAGPYPGPVPMEGPELCYSWFMEESVAVGPTGSVQNRAGGGKWLPSPVLNGTKVTLDIPLQEIGVTNRLAFQVVTGVDNEARDWFPDQADGCYPLIWESSPAAAPGSSSPVATPSSAAETIRQRDPAGDATGDAPDMVAVNTTIIPDDEVTLEIELADPQLCSPWFMEHGV